VLRSSSKFGQWIPFTRPQSPTTDNLRNVTSEKGNVLIKSHKSSENERFYVACQLGYLTNDLCEVKHPLMAEPDIIAV
jgi:hypothetical protein